jgi:hypothetical protein
LTYGKKPDLSAFIFVRAGPVHHLGRVISRLINRIFERLTGSSFAGRNAFRSPI